MIGHPALQARLAVVCVGLAFAATAETAAAAAKIELAEFRVKPAELRAGESFTIYAQAETTGVKLGSFVLRTADDRLTCQHVLIAPDH